MDNVVAFPEPQRASNKSKARKLKFTETKVEGLRHGGGGAEYVYDTERPGLAVRLTSGGTRTFVFVGRLHGKVERITLGRVGELSLANARSAVDKIRGDIALGVDVTGTRRALKAKQRRGRTLNEVFTEFVAGGRHKPKTSTDYRNLWTLYISRLGARRVEDVAAEDIRRLHISVAEAVGTRKQEGRSGHRTANKVIALVRAVLNFAGRKADNPAAGISLFILSGPTADDGRAHYRQVGSDGVERISTQAVLDLLEVPQKERKRGTFMRLSKLMREAGWVPIRARELTRGGGAKKDQARGYAREVSKRVMV